MEINSAYSTRRQTLASLLIRLAVGVAWPDVNELFKKSNRKIVFWLNKRCTACCILYVLKVKRLGGLRTSKDLKKIVDIEWADSTHVALVTQDGAIHVRDLTQSNVRHAMNSRILKGEAENKIVLHKCENRKYLLDEDLILALLTVHWIQMKLLWMLIRNLFCFFWTLIFNYKSIRLRQ